MIQHNEHQRFVRATYLFTQYNTAQQSINILRNSARALHSSHEGKANCVLSFDRICRFHVQWSIVYPVATKQHTNKINSTSWERLTPALDSTGRQESARVSTPGSRGGNRVPCAQVHSREVVSHLARSGSPVYDVSETQLSTFVKPPALS